MLTFTTLASGSLGNAALVSCGDTHILLDAGISAKRISAGLRERGVEPSSLAGIFLTHEHSDHVSGLRVLSSKAGAPIYATGPTLWEWYKRNQCGQMRDLFQKQAAGSGMQIGPLWVESFPTPHDAASSVGYSITDGSCRLVLCTDLGWLSPEVRQAVKGCDLLVCETNHDEDWVRSGPYVYALKQRILGDYGHLSNETGAELAAQAVESGARAVLLAHLSQTNNTPARAYEAVCLRLTAMGCDPKRDISLSVAPADVPGAVFLLEKGGVRVLPREEAVLC
ncbi:MAG: MBL fold metallo-hydrolase [Lawsonibacter sp.]|nr:MBL fold metallo-hydrolase [Lawsonibacter sp.]